MAGIIVFILMVMAWVAIWGIISEITNSIGMWFSRMFDPWFSRMFDPVFVRTSIYIILAIISFGALYLTGHFDALV